MSKPTPATERDELIKTIHSLMHQPIYAVIYPETEMENGYEVASRVVDYLATQKKQLLEAVLEGQKEYYEKHMNYAPDGDPSHVRLMAVPVSHIKKLMEEV